MVDGTVDTEPATYGHRLCRRNLCYAFVELRSQTSVLLLMTVVQWPECVYYDVVFVGQFVEYQANTADRGTPPQLYVFDASVSLMDVKGALLAG